MKPEVCTFRDQLAVAAARIRPSEPARVLVKGRAPLSRQGEAVGELQILLRLTFSADQAARGVLVFVWPSAAQAHSVSAMLQKWAAAPAPDDVEVEAKVVPVGDETGTQLKVRFPLTEVPASMAALLQLIERLGIAKAAAVKIAALTPTSAAAAKPATPAPPRTQLDDAERAKADAIGHNDVFDSNKHPRIGVNEEVTSSSGETFRLMTKRIEGRQRRVWQRLPGQRAAG